MVNALPPTMKAAVCHAPNKISIDDVPVPKPQGRELLVRVKVASLCHSDLGIVAGRFGFEMFPQILGHEAVSVVVELGPQAAPFGIQVGDLIGAPLWHDMCLQCGDCRNAGPQYCSAAGIKGVTRPGYFAEYSLVDAASAVVIVKASSIESTAINAKQCAPLFCAGVTVWDALEEAQLRPGETVAIVGVGGLGQLAVQYSAALGAKVVGLDILDAQLEACKGPKGASYVINTRDLDSQGLKEAVRATNEGELADVVIVTSGVVQAYTTALSVVRPRGRVISVGIPYDPVPLTLMVFTAQNIRFIGAHVPGQQAAKRCLDFTVRKQLFPKVHPRDFKLDELEEMMDLMRAGKVDQGRMTIQFF